MRRLAPAKLNLRLLVGPLGADGYHPVRTLMVALDGLADTVELRPAERRSVRCPGVAERDNLAWRALDVLEAAAGRALPCTVTIEKRIPAQAGLGGGSSDAAAVLVAADELFGLALGPGRLEALAADVGSDVPFFVRAGAQWAEGRGEQLRPGSAPPFGALIVKGAGGLATADVYGAFDRLPAPPPFDGTPAPSRFAELVPWVRNDLSPAALACDPRLGAVSDELRAAGAEAVLLCGSGSAMAGLFATRAAAAAAASRCADVVAVVAPAAAPA